MRRWLHAAFSSSGPTPDIYDAKILGRTNTYCNLGTQDNSPTAAMQPQLQDSVDSGQSSAICQRGDDVEPVSSDLLQAGNHQEGETIDLMDPAAVQTIDLLKLVSDHLATKQVPPEVKAEAERLKNEGNELMKADKYKEALERYTKAIQLDKHNAVFFCNRAAAHFKLNDNEQAVKDCLSALAIDPNYSKAHGRLGLAYTNLERLNEARVAYARALQLEPDNESYRTNLRVTEEHLAQAPGGTNGAGGLNFGNLLQNPALMNMANEMLSDPGMQNLISGLMGPGLQNAPQNQNNGMSALLEAGQMLAQHMQQQNPDLVEQLRRQMQPPGSGGEQQ